MTTIWKVDWSGPSISDANDGLCTNGENLCIHMPIFKKVFNTNVNFNLNDVFFVTYEKKYDAYVDCEPMRVKFTALGDVVFWETEYKNFFQRATVYTSLKPHNV